MRRYIWRVLRCKSVETRTHPKRDELRRTTYCVPDEGKPHERTTGTSSGVDAGWNGIRFRVPHSVDHCHLLGIQDHYPVFPRTRSIIGPCVQGALRTGAVAGRCSAAVRYLGSSEGISLTPQEASQIRIFKPLKERLIKQ